jgi:hypothetical protein
MIFGGCDGRPAACPKIRISAQAEIRAVNMWMRAVAGNDVRFAKQFSNDRVVLSKRIHIHGSGDRLHADVGQCELIGEPRLWNFAIRIGVGDPAAMWVASRSSQRDTGRKRSSRTHISCPSRNDSALSIDHPFSNFVGSVSGVINRDHDVCRSPSLHAGACAPNGSNTTANEILFVTSRYKDADVPRCANHALIHLSIRNPS